MIMRTSLPFFIIIIPLLAIALLFGTAESLSVPSPDKRRSLKNPLSLRPKVPFPVPSILLKQSANQYNGVNNVKADTASLLSPNRLFKSSLMVAIASAAMGQLYSIVLSASVSTVWQTIPSYLLSRFPSFLEQNIKYLPLVIVTLGGIIMGILACVLPKGLFGVADFVSTLSSKSPQDSDSGSSIVGDGGALKQIVPFLVLSLVTSTVGFSVGPEAPMVAAGALLGVGFARWKNDNSESGKSSSHHDKMVEECVLAYAGAVGALTAFMNGMPLAGAVFALELTRQTSGLTTEITVKGQSSDDGKQKQVELVPCAMGASMIAMMLIRGVFNPKKIVGGHFSYYNAAVDGALQITGRNMVLTSLATGVGGAVLGNIFVMLVNPLKKICWSSFLPSPSDKSDQPKNKWRREMTVKTLIGLTVGFIACYYPQTLFWGEGSLQSMIDGQRTALTSTHHGALLSSFVSPSSSIPSLAAVDPLQPFATSWGALQISMAKLCTIALACAGKFPGGIIFPLFFAAAPFAHAISISLSSILPASISPIMVMGLMASTQASVTRTPLATVCMLGLTMGRGMDLSAMLPPLILSSYVGVWATRLLTKKISYFKYAQA